VEAEKAVVAVAQDPSLLTAKGEDKRKAALNLVVGNLTSQGITIATSTINGALEAALVKAKADGSVK
jgi:hypothetical protein